MFCVDCLKLV